ncbi:MAG: hypothetical protein H6684_09565 [Deltaproteobacteria bacterium]|nr:hypothetical protein [Deltaproteobacteria bacterium]MCB9479380.1 hypothetical protein [Deltaproteobacteria bacterium]MCB9488964.1 hypothetical protein [Deltaproteobacteria bacterium]
MRRTPSSFLAAALFAALFVALPSACGDDDDDTDADNAADDDDTDDDDNGDDDGDDDSSDDDTGDDDDDDGPYMYVATRLNDGLPIVDQSLFAEAGVEQDGENINGPSLIRVPDWIAPEDRADPSAVYYLYFAHHGGKYIRMAWAADLLGPWTLHDVGEGIADGDRGVLDLGSDNKIELANGLLADGHMASPDVIVDDEARRIVMYFHIQVTDPDDVREQRTLVSYSPDGLEFEENIQPVILGVSYFRVFEFEGELYAIANHGQLYRAPDASDPWTPPPGFDFTQELWTKLNNPFQEHIELPEFIRRSRHSAVHVVDGAVEVFLTRVFDAPERIRFATMRPVDSELWAASDPPTELMEPEPGWECGELPTRPSFSGSAPEDVKQLRDPAYFQDADGSAYLVYSGCGENALGLAALTKAPVPSE